MITTAATVDARKRISGQAMHTSSPIVLIEGRPRLDLWVRTLTAEAPLDVRTAELLSRRGGAAFDTEQRNVWAKLDGQRVEIVQPIALEGGEAELLALAAGRCDAMSQQLGADADEWVIGLRCDWRTLLETPIEDGALERSPHTPWTLATLVEAVDVLGRLDLSTELLPLAVAERRISLAGVHLTTIGSLLKAVFDQHGVMVQRRLEWRGHRVAERRIVRLKDHGRPIRLAMATAANPAGVVESIRGELPVRRPTRLVAEANGQVVESTFTLVRGWNPADQDRDDGEYARSSSSDFDAVANVFRLWVLNEDGAFGGEPFDAGDAFDLTALFDEGRAITPQPLRLLNALTQDAAGRSVGVVIELSTDHGTSWSRYPGDASVLSDRAGVYLNDDALPGGFIAAVRSGAGAIRVTAALRNPLPLQLIRWRGNPFHDAWVNRQYGVGDSFAYRRVAMMSRYAAEVQAGQRSADTADDRAALSLWLAERASLLPPADSRVTVLALGPLVNLRVGDRLAKLAGRSIGLDLVNPSATSSSAVLRKVQHRWDVNTSVLEWELS